MFDRVGSVGEIWRYPVKSLRGEQLAEVDCNGRGIAEDRRWAIVGEDGKLGSGKSTRRFRRMPGLLNLASFIDPDGVTWVRFPDDRTVRVGDAASHASVNAYVGEPVTVAREHATSHFDDAAIHLLSTGSLRWFAAERPDLHVDVRRFRPNLLIDLAGSIRTEEAWVDRTVRVGESVLRIAKPTKRCVMTTMAQSDLPFEPGILKSLTRESDAILGVYAEVIEPGTIRVGDPVSVA